MWLSLKRTVNWVSNIIGVLCLLGTLILLDSSSDDANWMLVRSGESVSHSGVNFYASDNIPHRCSYMLICNNKHLVVFTNPSLSHSKHVKLLPVTCYEFVFPALLHATIMICCIYWFLLSLRIMISSLQSWWTEVQLLNDVWCTVLTLYNWCQPFQLSPELDNSWNDTTIIIGKTKLDRETQSLNFLLPFGRQSPEKKTSLLASSYCYSRSSRNATDISQTISLPVWHQ